MLFLLTGNVQTGKTRWLETVIASLTEHGVTCDGVLAPGVWRKRTDAEVAELERSIAEGTAGEHVAGMQGIGRFEKLGINNRLLPSGEEIMFARRRDLAEQAGEWRAESQSAKAQLGWEMSEESIARVNAHFDELLGGVSKGQGLCSFRSAEDAAASLPHFLIIDELGPLELLKGGGIYKAVRLLDAGPCQVHPHALVIVREQLVAQAKGRFASAWDEVREIHPNEEGRAAIFRALHLD